MIHYKDRKPKDTIEIIQNFFINKGYHINKLTSIQTSAGTYYSNFILYWKNNKIMNSNGKGLTKELSEASGLAELYERFCATISEGWFVNKKTNDIYKNREYQLIPKEEFLNDDYTKSYLEIMLPEMTNYYLDKYIKNFYNNKIYGNKYINLNNPNDIIYKNEHMMFVTNGSTGLAAGNSLEEALVQGISETYERLTIRYFFENTFNKNYQYFEINQNILPKHLQNIISQAEKNDYCKIHLYDLSYTFNLPVVGLILQDLNTHTYYYCFGSSPIFEIAVERCLTEVYQGMYHHNCIIKFTTSSEETDWETIASKQSVSHATGTMYIPENLILHSNFIDSYNKNVFIEDNENLTNLKILNKIKEINKKNNLEIYYSNISLSDQIFTIRVIFKEYLLKTCLITHKKWANQYVKEESACVFEINNKIIEGFNYILENNPDNLTNDQIEIYFNQLELMIQPILKKFDFDKILTSYYNLHSEIYSFYITGQKSEDRLIYNNSLIWNLYLNKYNFIKDNCTTLYPQIQQWLILKQYIDKGYSDEEIIKILKFFNYDPNIIKEKNNINNIFIIKQILKFLYESYNNLDYYDFINSFSK